VEYALAGGYGGPMATVGDLDEYLGAAADAGFASVSISPAHVSAVGEGSDALDQVAALLSRHGLRCSDVQALTVVRDDDATMDLARKFAVMAGALGAELVLTLLRTRVSEESIDRLARCADVVGSGGARLALEFVPGGAIDRIDAAASLGGERGSARSGMLIDSWHFFHGSSDWPELETVPFDLIAMVQFDDALAPISDDIMSETMDRRTWPGQGVLELDRFASSLTDRGWSGLVSVEVLSAELRQLDARTFTKLALETAKPYWS
jgi:sugar phosphate isomerase/epimerase